MLPRTNSIVRGARGTPRRVGVWWHPLNPQSESPLLRVAGAARGTQVRQHVLTPFRDRDYMIKCAPGREQLRAVSALHLSCRCVKKIRVTNRCQSDEVSATDFGRASGHSTCAIWVDASPTPHCFRRVPRMICVPATCVFVYALPVGITPSTPCNDSSFALWRSSRMPFAPTAHRYARTQPRLFWICGTSSMIVRMHHRANFRSISIPVLDRTRTRRVFRTVGARPDRTACAAHEAYCGEGSHCFCAGTLFAYSRSRARTYTFSHQER